MIYVYMYMEKYLNWIVNISIGDICIYCGIWYVLFFSKKKKEEN